MKDTDPLRFWIHIKAADIVVRFKKLDDELRVSNFPTRGARRFNGQMQLPGMPACPRLTLGYQMNEARTEILGVHLAFLLNRRLMWSYQLPERGAVVLPIPAQRKLGEVAAPEVKLKKQKKDDSAGNEDER